MDKPDLKRTKTEIDFADKFKEFFSEEIKTFEDRRQKKRLTGSTGCAGITCPSGSGVIPDGTISVEADFKPNRETVEGYSIKSGVFAYGDYIITQDYAGNSFLVKK